MNAAEFSLKIDGAYSYERGLRVSKSFWNAVRAELQSRGYSLREIVEFIWSKHTRWMLDNLNYDAKNKTRSGRAVVQQYLDRNEQRGHLVLADVKQWIAAGNCATINEEGDVQ